MSSKPRENRLQTLLEGCGAGILLMLRYTWLHLSPTHTDLYHRLLPMNSVYGGVAIDLVLLCLVFAAIFQMLDRFDPQGKSLWWTLFAAIFAAQAWGFLIWTQYLSVHLIHPAAWFMACACVGIALWLWKRSSYRKAVSIFRGAMALLGISIIWMLPQLTYMAFHPEPHEGQMLMHPVPSMAMPARRIVWIVFDELSQDQTFDHRQPDIELPALDAFRAQSTMFSNLQPAGYYTELVLPSLLWGKTILDERSDLSGNLSVKTSTHRWQQFPADESLFAQAQRDGWSTGVAGWYNPYCRTYGAWLNWCQWTLRAPIPGEYSPQKSVWWNAAAPLIRSESRFRGKKLRPPSTAEYHASDYRDLMQWSHTLLDDQDIGFVFLHLPLPHPGGFYNRKTGQLGANGSYLDNLALTDKSLAQIMQWIGQTSLASKTTIVLCSDHSWRVPMWRKTPLWTKEDATVSGDRFDPRPVLMVHLPEQVTPETIRQRFPALKEHDLIKTLLENPMTPNALEVWVQKQSSATARK